MHNIRLVLRDKAQCLQNEATQSTMPCLTERSKSLMVQVFYFRATEALGPMLPPDHHHPMIASWRVEGIFGVLETRHAVNSKSTLNRVKEGPARRQKQLL